MLDEVLASIRPESILDVGCGCAQSTEPLCRYSARVTAIDVASSLIPRWTKSFPSSPIRFSCMDARKLGFADSAFPLVHERDTLHHVLEWRRVIDEMVRVSSKHVIIEEPVDDLRSPAKRRTFEAQNLFLELQREVGYQHYPHLPPADLIDYVRKRTSLIEASVTRSDEPISCERFFRSFGDFAARSARGAYWWNRLEAFRSALGDSVLSEDDGLFIVAEVGGVHRRDDRGGRRR